MKKEIKIIIILVIVVAILSIFTIIFTKTSSEHNNIDSTNIDSQGILHQAQPGNVDEQQLESIFKNL